MLKKALSIAAVVAGAALSAVGIISIVRDNDTVEPKEKTTTTTETIQEKESEK